MRYGIELGGVGPFTHDENFVGFQFLPVDTPDGVAGYFTLTGGNEAGKE